MAELSLTYTVPDEIMSALEAIKRTEKQISDNENFISQGRFICPICQEGSLRETARGKMLGLIADQWLICSKCQAEFDKKFDKAILMKATEDPYGVYASKKNQKLLIDEWKKIPVRRIQKINSGLEADIETLKLKIEDFVAQQVVDGKIKLILADLSGFILKKGEEPLFALPAELIEERKQRVTHRTYTGGNRNYGGFSFRVAKGIYFHTGSSSADSRGTASSYTSEFSEMVSADTGDFVVTSQRVLFRGHHKKGFAITIGKIAYISIDSDQNALMIVQENRKPVTVKIATSFSSKIQDIDVKLSIPANHVVDIINKCSQNY